MARPNRTRTSRSAARAALSFLLIAEHANERRRCAQQASVAAVRTDHLHSDGKPARSGEQRQRHGRQAGQGPERAKRRIARGLKALRRNAWRRRREDRIEGIEDILETSRIAPRLIKRGEVVGGGGLSPLLEQLVQCI